MLNDRPKVVITHRVHREVLELLDATCELVVNSSAESWPVTTLMEHVADADALMVFMPDCVDDDFLARCPKLKIIAGALKGYDNFDVPACTRRGVWFTIAPDLLAIPTAELALGLMLGLTRHILEGDRYIRSGQFRGWRPSLYGSGIFGRTIGIVGMGKLGQALVAMLQGFQVQVFYVDPVAMPAEDELRWGVMRVDFPSLLKVSDVVVVMAPLTASTIHLFNENTLAMLKQGAFLVNIGRGSVVDETAVAQALDSGHLAGYAADVFAMEDWALSGHPSAIDPGLLKKQDDTVLTPHLGSAVHDVRLQIELAAARSIQQALRGETPDGAVNDVR